MLLKKLKACFYAVIAILKGKNDARTPVDTIHAQLHEARPLPIGKAEFEEWSDRIISGAIIPGVSAESTKFALADQLMHLGPTEDHK
jgi:hypothetical protein